MLTCAEPLLGEQWQGLRSEPDAHRRPGQVIIFAEALAIHEDIPARTGTTPDPVGAAPPYHHPVRPGFAEL